MKLTPGKLGGLKSVSDARGVIAAAAMDQRGSLQKSLAKERGAAATGQDLEDFKTLVTDVLCQHASAILLDPEFGLPASTPSRQGSAARLREDWLRCAARRAACPICSTSGPSAG